MERQQFYVTLPSNSSLATFSDNTPGHFQAKLPRSLHLKGSWEVALSSILFTHSFYNVTDKGNLIIYTDGNPHNVTRSFKMINGYYEDGKDLLKEIRRNLSEVAQERIQFNIEDFSRKLEIKVTDGAAFSPDKHIAKLLGLNSGSRIIENNVKGDNPIDANREMHAFFVYTDIIHPTVVGGQEVPLLKIIDVPHKKINEVVTRSFSAPEYMPLRTNHIESVEINISTANGQSVHFESGLCVVRLHFRKVSPMHLI